MSLVQGVVQKISSNGKAASIKVNGVFYGCGFGSKPEKLPCKEGDTIEFQSSQNGQWNNADIRTIRVIAAGVAVNVPGAAAGAAVPARDRAAEDAQRQRSITWQASRNAAIEVARLAKELDILPLGAKKADQLQALKAFIHDTTVEFYVDTDTVANKGVDVFANPTQDVQEEDFSN